MSGDLGYEWSGLTLQQKKSEGEAGIIFGMAIVFVFLLLAAQYESWTLPFAVLLCTPLAVLGDIHRFSFAQLRKQRLCANWHCNAHRLGGEKRDPDR